MLGAQLSRYMQVIIYAHDDAQAPDTRTSSSPSKLIPSASVRYASLLATPTKVSSRAAKAFRAASAEILREQASALEGTANSAVADKKVV